MILIIDFPLQHYVTSTITTVFSAFSSFGLAAVSAWFASERVVFSRHKGKKWLADVLDDASDSFVGMPGVRWVTRVTPEKSKEAAAWSNKVFERTSSALGRIGSFTARTFKSHSDTSSNTALERDNHPMAQSTDMLPPGSPTPTDNTRFSSENGAGPEPSAIHGTIQRADEEAAGPSAPSKTRFANLVRNVMMVHRTTGFGNSPKARRMSSGNPEAPPRLDTDHVIMPRSSRVASLVPKLRNMVPTQDIAAHAALVRHIQVSCVLFMLRNRF